MSRCPLAKRTVHLVDAERRSEFRDAWEIYSVVTPNDAKFDSGWTYIGDDLVLRPHALLDNLHTHMPEPYRWRIVAGYSRERHHQNGDGTVNVAHLIRLPNNWKRYLHWIIVQFNNDHDAVRGGMVAQ